uniref:Uncharacterized protein n=1 Tax=Glossina pallidipes TaxID=7398 RepID=A0A1A9ZYV0_GLOPL
MKDKQQSRDANSPTGCYKTEICLEITSTQRIMNTEKITESLKKKKNGRDIDEELGATSASSVVAIIVGRVVKKALGKGKGCREVVGKSDFVGEFKEISSDNVADTNKWWKRLYQHPEKQQIGVPELLLAITEPTPPSLAISTCLPAAIVLHPASR